VRKRESRRGRKEPGERKRKGWGRDRNAERPLEGERKEGRARERENTG